MLWQGVVGSFQMRSGAGCWIAVMGEFGKDSYQHGPPSQAMWGVNFEWIQESVYLLAMLLPAKSRWYYVGSWMYC